MQTRVTLGKGGYTIRSRYDAGFIAALKTAIPANERRFDSADRVWIVSTRHGQTVAQLIRQYYGESVVIPQPVDTTPKTTTEALEVRYIGTTKPRDGLDEPAAYGWVSGAWSVILPESVLRAWFLGSAKDAQTTTLYGVLGIPRDADDGAVKSAYRRLARQWHPDICREPDAQERFIKIQAAYEALGDPGKRARYDAGLFFESSVGTTSAQVYDKSLFYRAPLRCGYILADGVDVAGWFTVSRIIDWSDIVDAAGRVLVTSWALGDKSFTEDWR